ncbi:Retrovirus-related Pol polyprotein from type-1 retrotransposable element R1 2 [Lucilia cuprina]|nr:Retrovirus-related Pol polyprotein from type-1 retrotransposable element R1 2 [Lucilia cuprina]
MGLSLLMFVTEFVRFTSMVAKHAPAPNVSAAAQATKYSSRLSQIFAHISVIYRPILLILNSDLLESMSNRIIEDSDLADIWEKEEREGHRPEEPPLDENKTWKTVKNKSKPRKRRNAAMIIAAEGDTSYADILKQLKGDPSLKDVRESVSRIRRTQKGELLLEINTKDQATEIMTRWQETIIECRDIDEVTAKDDIRNAFLTQLGSLRRAYGGTQTATISLPSEICYRLLQIGKVKIGWVVCRKDAWDTDTWQSIVQILKTDLNCVEAKDCTKDPECMLCKQRQRGETDHVAGSGRCPPKLVLINLQTSVLAKDKSSKTAIWACGKRAIENTQKQLEEGFVRAKIGGIYIYSCYAPPSASIEQFEQMLNRLKRDAETHNPKIVAGNFNAWSTEWGSRSTNNRGRILLETFSSDDLTLVNKGDANTFRARGLGSIVDLTFASSSMARRIDWKSIIFTIEESNTKYSAKNTAHTSFRGWASNKLDEESFKVSITSSLTLEGTATEMASQLMSKLREECDISMPRRRLTVDSFNVSTCRVGLISRPPNYWWNMEISNLRKKCLKSKRRSQRRRNRHDFMERQEEYKIARREFQNAISRSKRKCFGEICLEAEADPWGKAYKVVTSRLKAGRSPQPTYTAISQETITAVTEVNIVVNTAKKAIEGQGEDRKYCAIITLDVKNEANETVNAIRVWMKTSGLDLDEHKTEAVLISSRRKREKINVQIGNHTISSQQHLTYLGVIMEDKLNFKPHIEKISSKASNIAAALSRMMPNVGGPKQCKRRLISTVVKSTILYAAPIWSEALKVKSATKKMKSVYRLCALRVCSSYRTNSEEAAYVVAGMIPIEILADEARPVYEQRKSNPSNEKEIAKLERLKSIQIWQNSWEESLKGRWTFRLIPKIEPWVLRCHGEVKYYLTQFLTGHGGYRCYLYKFGLDTTPNCPYCKTQTEDAEHVMFCCPRFENARLSIEIVIGRVINVANIIDVAMEKEENWDVVCSFIKEVHEKLRVKEKQRKLLLHNMVIDSPAGLMEKKRGVVFNNDNCPTFIGGRGSSIIDITFGSPDLCNQTMEWKVLDDLTLSDHQYIAFNIDVELNLPRWNITNLNNIEVPNIVKPFYQMTEIITKCCNDSMPKASEYNKKKRPAFWWNSEIKGLRIECLHARRMATRNHSDDTKEKWIDDDPVAKIVSTLFPKDIQGETCSSKLQTEHSFVAFNIEELNNACKKLKTGKSPVTDIATASKRAKGFCCCKSRGINAFLNNTVGDYLHDRVLMYKTDVGNKEYRITAGVPGISPWAADAHIKGYADDVALLISHTLPRALTDVIARPAPAPVKCPEGNLRVKVGANPCNRFIHYVSNKDNSVSPLIKREISSLSQSEKIFTCCSQHKNLHN